MSRFCIQCGSALSVEARFCGSCGKAVSVESILPVENGISPPLPAPSDAASPIFTPPPETTSRPEYYDSPEPLTDAESQPIEIEDHARSGPNWLLIGGGVAILFFLVAYYMIFIRDDRPSNPAGPAPKTAAVTTEAAVEAKQFYTVADANIRDRPTTQGTSILGKLPRGSAVTGTLALGEDGISEWLELPDGKGYVGGVNLSETKPPVITKPLGDKKWVADKALDIWSQPDASATVIDRVPAGTPLSLFGLTGNDYIEIKLRKGGVGYIAEGVRILTLAGTTGKPIAISFNPSTCNFGGELEAEFEGLSKRIRAAYEAAEKVDYPSEAAREKALMGLEGKSDFQKLQRSFNGLSITAIAQHYESQSVYFTDAPDKVIAAFRDAGYKVGKDGAFPLGDLSAGIGASGGDGRKYGRAELSCGV